MEWGIAELSLGSNADSGDDSTCNLDAIDTRRDINIDKTGAGQWYAPTCRYGPGLAGINNVLEQTRLIERHGHRADTIAGNCVDCGLFCGP